MPAQASSPADQQVAEARPSDGATPTQASSEGSNSSAMITRLLEMMT
jgi:hypothetical protein